MFDQYDNRYGQQQLDWNELVVRSYNEYMDDCKCDPDECDCLSFVMFEDKLLTDMEEAQ